MSFSWSHPSIFHWPLHKLKLEPFWYEEVKSLKMDYHRIKNCQQTKLNHLRFFPELMSPAETSFDALQALRWFSTWTGPNSKADDWHMLWLSDDNYLEKQSRRPHLHSVKRPALQPRAKLSVALCFFPPRVSNSQHKPPKRQEPD